jgi:putative FmdB family regulatory protein
MDLMTSRGEVAPARALDRPREHDMPIFEYKCRQCGHVMEVLQKGRDAETLTCTQCGGSNLQKLLSGFAVGRASESPACDSCSSLPTCGGCMGGVCPMPPS